MERKHGIAAPGAKADTSMRCRHSPPSMRYSSLRVVGVSALGNDALSHHVPRFDIVVKMAQF
jgi:hypothetical protein